MANKAKMVDGHKCALRKDLEGYYSVWDIFFVPSKQAARKAKGLKELSQKYNFSSSYLKLAQRELRWHRKKRK